MYRVTQGGPSARRDLDPLQLRGYFENKRACFTTPWGRRMSPEAWPSLWPFPALLPPLLASQVSAVHLVTLLALGQPRQRLGRGTAPRAGAQGIGRPIPFRSLPPPKPRPSKQPHPQWLTPGLAYPSLPCPLAGSLSSYVLAWETLPASDWVVWVIRSGFRLPWCSAKIPLSTCHPALWPPGNPLALGALDQEVALLLSKGAMEEVASPSYPEFYGRIFVVPKALGG